MEALIYVIVGVVSAVGAVAGGVLDLDPDLVAELVVQPFFKFL